MFKIGEIKITLKGFAGYLVDMIRIAGFNFVNPHSFTKFCVINKIRKKTHSKILIEAGTFKGVMAGRCAFVFDHVFTIELDPKLAEMASKYLVCKKNVEVIQGDVMKVLPGLLIDEKINNALLFLDGHFSGGLTACGDLPEPAVEALQIISKHSHKVKAIVVDDFRCFGTEKGFPRKFELLKTVEECFPDRDFEITVHLDQLVVVRRNKR